MRKKCFILFICLCQSFLASAETGDFLETRKHSVDVRLELRGDYQRVYQNGTEQTDECGFMGQFANLILEGTFAKEFTWFYRQRLHMIGSNFNFFDSIDKAWLKWERNNWEVSAGKLDIMVGGFEYDTAPIDFMFFSEAMASLKCYEWGITGGKTFGKNDRVLIQFCQSPMNGLISKDLYAYNAIWYGVHNWYSSIWSVNFFEYEKGRFINYIALGNRFKVGRVTLDLDLNQRMGVGDGSKPFDDYSVIGRLSVMCCKNYLEVVAKGTYSHCGSVTSDILVSPGTALSQVGGGLFCYPVKNTKNLRIHLFYAYFFGNENRSPYVYYNDKESSIQLGLTWKVSIVDLIRKMKKSDN